MSKETTNQISNNYITKKELTVRLELNKEVFEFLSKEDLLKSLLIDTIARAIREKYQGNIEDIFKITKDINTGQIEYECIVKFGYYTSTDNDVSKTNTESLPKPKWVDNEPKEPIIE